MSTSTNEDRLVEHLKTIAEREDRATLAALRASLQEGRELEGLRVVLPFLGKQPTRRVQDDALLLAGLFALHPESGSLTLASALRLMAATSESVELRFRALLNAGREDLATHLRHAVALAASGGHALDWSNLRRVIRQWDHADGNVRREWARDFWAENDSDEDTKENAS